MPNTLSLTPAVQGQASSGALEPHSESYVARAFWNQYNVILLAGAALFSVALASFVPILVAAVAEVVWLGIGARSAAFRSWVAHRAFLERRARLEQELESSLAALDPSYRERFAAMGRAISEILELLGGQMGVSRSELETATLKLDEVRAAFLRFSAIHQRLFRFAAETPVTDLEREVVRLREQFSGEKDLGVRVTVRQALGLAERRLQQWQQIGNTRRTVEVQLDTVEKSFSYVKSRAMGFATGPEILREIDGLLSQVSSVGAFEAETQDATRFPSMAG